MLKVTGRCLLLWFLFTVPQFAAADVTGTVVGVADGDTVTILDDLNRQYKVRLSGIDAPEKGQPYGQRSKQTLSECAFGRSASVEGNKLDRYGRLVGKVHVMVWTATCVKSSGVLPGITSSTSGNNRWLTKFSITRLKPRPGATDWAFGTRQRPFRRGTSGGKQTTKYGPARGCAPACQNPSRATVRYC